MENILFRSREIPLRFFHPDKEKSKMTRKGAAKGKNTFIHTYNVKIIFYYSKNSARCFLEKRQSNILMKSKIQRNTTFSIVKDSCRLFTPILS